MTHDELSDVPKLIASLRQAENQRDSLVQLLVRLFGWEDESYAHAVMHVENAVLNLKADAAVNAKTVDMP
jgi:hypothetical protein